MSLRRYGEIYWVDNWSASPKDDAMADQIILNAIATPSVVIDYTETPVYTGDVYCYRVLRCTKFFTKNFNAQSILHPIYPIGDWITAYVIQGGLASFNNCILYTGDEAVTVIHSLFNCNSLHLLYSGNCLYDKRFLALARKTKAELSGIGIPASDWIIDSSAIMALYGLRKVNDLDFLCVKDIVDRVKSADCHNQYVRYYGKTAEELIYNPEYQLWFDGVKFITLDVLREFKRNRGEQKDKYDLKMIALFKQDARRGIISRCRYALTKFLATSYQIKRNAHERAARIKASISNIFSDNK